ncbi:MAG: hypothetical protein E7561_03990 [Ruminococcaceae bacterium]|nr:hypothetical protein [Oscillospiraceae bacterium]
MKKLFSVVLSVAILLGCVLSAPIIPFNASATTVEDSSEWISVTPKTPTVTTMENSELLDTLMENYTSFVVVRQRQLGGSHYAYTEAPSDTVIEKESSPNNEETPWRPGSELVLVELNRDGDTVTKTETVLISDGDGVIRDPDVSEDGTKFLFSWNKIYKDDDYHLYEYDLLTNKYRQLTFGVGVADTEPRYMPNGDIVFSSTRMTQIIDCFYTPVSNLYTCGPNGENIVRLGYDQVHTTYPTVTSDGRVLYTRWDYNDRTQVYTQAIFQMFPDGTNQTEVYGNNTNFPPSLLHSREVVGTTDKYISIASGHHCYQTGKLCIIDTSKGRNSTESVNDTLKFIVAKGDEDELPNIQSADDEYHDIYGQWGVVYKYPYSVTEDTFLVSSADIGYLNGSYEPEITNWANNGWGRTADYRIYIMNTEGDKVELVGGSGTIGASQIIPIKKHTLFERASMVNYGSDTGTYYIGNIYEGDGLKDVPFGAAKYLRVVALDYRAYTTGNVGTSDTTIDSKNGGQQFGPVSIGNGSWDVKRVLGIVPIEEDGSALFKVPSETPVFFQVLDENGCMIQTMRSWSTLMPGETFSCVGCHEDKNTVPPASSTTTIAMKNGVRELQPDFWQDEDYDPYTESKGFSYLEEVQPILDESCVSCHNDISAAKSKAAVSSLSSVDKVPTTDSSTNVSTESTIISPRESTWQYVIDTAPADDWYSFDFDDSAWSTGQAMFGNNAAVCNTTWKGDGSYIWLRREFTLTQEDINNLSGKQLFLNTFYDESPQVYLNGTLVFSTSGHTTAYEVRDLNLSSTSLLRVGKNVLAVRADNLGNWGSSIDVELAAKEYSGSEFSLGSYRFGIAPDENSNYIGKAFPISYLVLVGNESGFRNYDASSNYINWNNTMSDAEMLKPYNAGSAKSKLITMLRENHSGVRLTEKEIRTIEAWIDLAVPCCGDYLENNLWNDNQIRWANESQNKRDFYTKLNDLARAARAAGGSDAAPDISISYTSGSTVYDKVYDFATTKRLEIPKKYAAGDTVTVTLPEGEYYLGLTLNSRMGESILYVPSGTYTFTVPDSTLSDIYTPTFYQNTFNTITARVIDSDELGERHNLSVNPYDTANNKTAYPHATANGSYENSDTNAVRNAIDGVLANKDYGAYPSHSWGGSNSGGDWMAVDFAREVKVEEIDIKLRADFSGGDTYWLSGVLEFSDGSTKEVTFEKTAEVQTVTLDSPVATSYVKLKSLVKADETNALAGISEISVYGTEEKAEPDFNITMEYKSGSTVYNNPDIDVSGATLSVPKAYTAGDTITITLPEGEHYLGVTLNKNVGEALLYIPSGTFTYKVPSAYTMSAAFEPTFASNTSNTITARIVSNLEWNSRRNIALNPYDLDDASSAFPHATASDWHANAPAFAPRNAIDGVTKNESHNGWPYQSWGPASTGEHWLQINFGEEIRVSEIGVYLRNNNSSGHTFYKSATLEFSDGSTQDVTFEESLDKQVATFDTVKTSYVKFTNIVKFDETATWGGITEFEIYNDGTPVAPEIPVEPEVPEDDESGNILAHNAVTGGLYRIDLSEDNYVTQGKVVDVNSLVYNNINPVDPTQADFAFYSLDDTSAWVESSTLGKTDEDIINLLTDTENTEAVQLKITNNSTLTLQRRMALAFDLGTNYDINTLELTQLSNTSYIIVHDFSVYTGNTLDATIFKNCVGRGGITTNTTSTMSVTLNNAENSRYVVVVFDSVTASYDNGNASQYSYMPIITNIAAYGSKVKNIVSNENVVGKLYNIALDTPLTHEGEFVDNLVYDNLTEAENKSLNHIFKLQDSTGAYVNSVDLRYTNDQVFDLLATEGNETLVKIENYSGGDAPLSYRAAIGYNLGAKYKLEDIVLQHSFSDSRRIYNFSVYAGDTLDATIFSNCIGKGGSDSQETLTAELNSDEYYSCVLIVFDHVSVSPGLINVYAYQPLLSGIKIYGKQQPNILSGADVTGDLYNLTLSTPLVQHATEVGEHSYTAMEAGKDTGSNRFYTLNDEGTLVAAYTLKLEDDQILKTLASGTNNKYYEIQHSTGGDAPLTYRAAIVYDLGKYYKLDSLVLTQYFQGSDDRAIHRFSVYAGNTLDLSIFNNQIGRGGSATDTAMEVTLNQTTAARYLVIVFDHVAMQNNTRVEKYAYNPKITGIACYGTETEAPSDVVYGDTTGDDKVNILDYISLSKAIDGQLTLSVEVADLNKDGEIDVNDLVVLRKILLGVPA